LLQYVRVILPGSASFYLFIDGIIDMEKPKSKIYYKMLAVKQSLTTAEIDSSAKRLFLQYHLTKMGMQSVSVRLAII
jgi:hypothetical protein